MNLRKPHIIINPFSGGGKTRKRLNYILSLLKRYCSKGYSLCVTQGPLEATFSARKTIVEGCELVISIGGDGTIHETVNGFFSNGRLINPACQLGIINCGTGHGFAQSLKLPSTIEKQFEVIFNGTGHLVDIGKIIFSDKNGETLESFFVNECQAGIGGEVVKKIMLHHKKLGGLIAFGVVTLSTAFSYPNQLVTIEIDGTYEVTKRFIGITVGNGKYTAGGMNLTPSAELNDGLLDILLIHEQSLLHRIWNFSGIYSGRHIVSQQFSYFQGKGISLNSSEKILVEADGELLGFLPCRIEVMPSALSVKLNCSERSDNT
ncbi:MAG: diacylglycerol kinase family lipid kinase [Nitrospirota bacterium]|nr:diacylglycerol kinase family lipid kinase [Nitrospirota bacterium]